jgi:hypothetical protein
VAKGREPTKAQRAGLGKALLLKKRCEALGVEWDGTVVKDNEDFLPYDDDRPWASAATMRGTRSARRNTRTGERGDHRVARQGAATAAVISDHGSTTAGSDHDVRDGAAQAAKDRSRIRKSC